MVHYLSKIELGIILGGNALNLKEGCVGPRIALATFVPKNAAFGVQTIISNVRTLLYCLTIASKLQLGHPESYLCRSDPFKGKDDWNTPKGHKR